MTEGAESISAIGEAGADAGAASRADAGVAPGRGRGAARVALRAGRRAARAGLMAALAMVVLAGLIALGVLALTGKPIRLPVWAVAEAEARANAVLSDALPGASLSLGRIEIMLEDGWTPRLRLEDLRLMQGGQQTLLALPDVRLRFDAGALATWQGLRPSALRLIGGEVALRRQADGTLDLRLGSLEGGPQLGGLADLFALLDRVLEHPMLSHLRLIEAEAASLRLEDARLSRVWTVGDGRVRLENRPDALAAELGLSLVGGGAAPAQAIVTLIRPRGEASVRLTAAITDVAAADLAAQTPVLGWLAPLDAPISGRITAGVSDQGLTGLEADMTLGAGALQPGPDARPIGFDSAALSLGYEADRGRLILKSLSVESRTLRLKAGGHAYPLGDAGEILTGALGQRLPSGFLGQMRIDEAQLDPEGLFERPLVFTAGAMDARLRMEPFGVDIGQVSLVEEQGHRLSLSGKASVGAGGWSLAVDLGLDAIAHDRLLQLWPRTAVPRTRDWIGQNVAQGLLTDVRAALRLAPGQEPRLSLGYEFDGAEARFLRTLPPITDGRGRSSIDGLAYTLVMDSGRVEAPAGGSIDIAGAVFSVEDITAKPAQAQIRLKTDSSLTAALSLLDLPPFNFMTKAGRSPDLGEGRAVVDTRLSLPLVRRVALQDVSYEVSGEILGLTSDRLVNGRTVTADRLELTADPTGLAIGGPGRIGRVPFDVTFRQGFGAADRGLSTVAGQVTLSPATVAEFGLGLPAGMVSGEGRADIRIDLPKGAPGRLTLGSDLRGIGLALPPIGWSKPPGGTGRLEVGAVLGTPPQIERIALSGGGMEAEGAVELAAGGGLVRARFGRVQLNGWLDAAVDLIGRGAGRPADIVLNGGTVDLRRFDAPQAGGGAGNSAAQGGMVVNLDRLVVAESIALTRFSGSFTQRGGLNGDFQGLVNGGPAVTGSAVPARGGTAVRIRSTAAGEVLAAAGIFKSARGGRLDLHLTPRGAKGHYDGRAEIANIRVRDANVLAELLSAISVVGLLEQLNGAGILFSDAEADFIVTPDAVEISHAAATGASLGVSMAGLYGTRSKRLALQGVVSPVYLLNGVGAVLTRRGEGLFGFNYGISGTSDAPQVQVNPLSILTPGMFREIFRRPAPVLRQNQ